MYIRHNCGQLVQERVVTVNLCEKRILVEYIIGGIPIVSYLFQEFHILAAHASLAELQQSVSSGGIVQDDLEDLRAEEVSKSIVPSICGAVLRWNRK